MKEQYCVKEQEVTAAASDGSSNAEILNHARSCPVCSEVLLVAQFLREGVQLAAHDLPSLPDASIIWRKAQSLVRQKALARAALPIRAVRIVAFAVGAIVAPLLILKSVRIWPDLPDLWARHGSASISQWPVGLNVNLLMFTITGAIILIGLSSWFMLREE
jgi:hypothetical protein